MRSVVVVSHRPGPWLAPCLASVVGQADQVVLVDNGSAASEASAVGIAAGVDVVRSRANTGFTGGVALGLARARGSLVALLNDDAVADAGWLDAAAAELATPGTAAVAARVLLAGAYRPVSLDDPVWRAPGDDRPLGRQVRSVTVGGTECLPSAGGRGIHRLERDAGGDVWRWTAGPATWWVPAGDDPDAEVRVDGAPVAAGPPSRLLNSAGTFLRADGYAGDIGFLSPDDPRFDAPRECFAASGVALVTSADVLAEVGGLAGGFFAYYEDVDWSWRARLAGLAIRYRPDARIEHRRAATSGGEDRDWVRVLAERNRTSTLVRNAPGAVAARHLRERLRSGDDPAVRAAVLRALPAALAGRARQATRLARRAAEVWERWADADTPADPGGAAPGDGW